MQEEWGWELPLSKLAADALKSGSKRHLLSMKAQQNEQYAYQRCYEITRANSKTFFMASSLLPAEKRRAVQALYAFCRLSDDLVDRPDETLPLPALRADLDDWRCRVQNCRADEAVGGDQQSVLVAWSDVRRKFDIPFGYVDQFIDGIALDLESARYQTFEQLTGYCYGVACTVGLMSMHIVGFQGPEALPYAIRLGVALQLTNILRDVGEDWRTGRLYLPLDELHAFGLDETDIAAGQVTPRWRAFMRHQIRRVHKIYDEALPGVALLNQDGRFAIAAAGELYRGILDEIERNDYDVFSQRAHVSAFGKLRRLPRIWWRANTMK
jgi:15-cis-phytoene synthase